MSHTIIAFYTNSGRILSWHYTRFIVYNHCKWLWIPFKFRTKSLDSSNLHGPNKCQRRNMFDSSMIFHEKVRPIRQCESPIWLDWWVFVLNIARIMKDFVDAFVRLSIVINKNQFFIILARRAVVRATLPECSITRSILYSRRSVIHAKCDGISNVTKQI